MKNMYIIRDSETGDIVVTNEGAVCFCRKRHAESALYNSITWSIHREMEFLKSKGYGDLVKQFKDLRILHADQREKYGSASLELEMECSDNLALIQEKLMEYRYYSIKKPELVDELRKVNNGRFYIEKVTSFKTKEEDLWKDY